MTRSSLVSLAFIAFCGAATAHGSLWENVFRGLDVLATPTGGPLRNTGDGTRVNGARSGRLRIVPSGIGPGYQLELDRTFGTDSRGRPEILRLGGIGELTLDGGVQLTLGYNGRDFRTVRGSLSVGDLSYNLRTKLGAQDAQLTGTLNVLNSFELNPLGFYDVTINVSNANSEFSLDGVAVRTSDETNFNVGPIVVQGNIFFDAAVALLTSLGVDTSGLEDIFPQSPIDQINAAIEDSLQGARAVAGTSTEADLGPLLLQSVLEGDKQSVETLLGGLAAGSLSGDGVSKHAGSPGTMPEPGTLMLVALGGTTMWYWRRR